MSRSEERVPRRHPQAVQLAVKLRPSLASRYDDEFRMFGLNGLSKSSQCFQAGNARGTTNLYVAEDLGTKRLLRGRVRGEVL